MYSLLLCRKDFTNYIFIMITPLITWGCIVGLFIIILLVRIVKVSSSLSSSNKTKLLSFMSEREEFFVPGDPNPRMADYDFEDFDDL